MAVHSWIFKPFSVRGLLAGRKPMTRRVLTTSWPVLGHSWAGPKNAHLWDGFGWTYALAVNGPDPHIRLPWRHPDDIARRGPVDAVHDGWYRIRPPVRGGDLVWVRETWRPLEGYSNWDLRIRYAADDTEVHLQDGDADVGDWRFPKAAKKGMVTPLYMPRWASRLTLEVTSVLVERLQDISERDALAEGIEVDFETGAYWGVQADGAGGACRRYDCARLAYRDLWDSIHGKGAWDEDPWVAAYRFRVHHQNVDQLLAERGEAA